MKNRAAIALICGLLLVLVAGCSSKPRTCPLVPNRVAVCVNGRPVPWAASVIQTGPRAYFAPVDDVVATLHIKVEVSPDKTRVTLNNTDYQTAGALPILEQNGKLYVNLIEAGLASFNVVQADIAQNGSVNIITPPPPPPPWQQWLKRQLGRL